MVHRLPIQVMGTTLRRTRPQPVPPAAILVATVCLPLATQAIRLDMVRRQATLARMVRHQEEQLRVYSVLPLGAFYYPMPLVRKTSLPK